MSGPNPEIADARHRRGEDVRAWSGHPRGAAAVRLAAFVTPIVASVLGSVVLSRVLPAPRTGAQLASWWILVAGASTLVLLGTDRLARRLLPLAALMKLTLVFPDEAPSRFRVAIRSGTVRQLEEKLAHLRDHGLATGPAQAAEQLIELVGALNVHDRRTRGHSERVRAFADLVGEELGLPDEDREKLHWGALLHDVGKLTVPPEILNKAGRPDDHEWQTLMGHPAAAREFLAPLLPWLGDWAAAAWEHHERFGGGGYPRGIHGDEITLAGRIVAVADAFEVITAVRSYKEAMPAEQGRQEIARCAGTHFDPRVVRAFLNVSLGRLRLAMGPLSWVAQLPFLRPLPIGPALGTAGSAAMAMVGVVFGGLVDAPDVARPVAVASAPEQAPLRLIDDHREDPFRLDVGPAAPTAPVPAPTASAPVAVVSRPASPAPAEVAPAAPTTTTTAPVTTTTVPPSTTTTVAPGSPPVAVDDAVTIAEDAAGVVIDVLANDLDDDGDPLTVASHDASAVALGMVTDLGGGLLRYVPEPEQSGTDVFTYVVSDPGGGTDTAAVTVTITPVADAPVAEDDAYLTAPGVALVQGAPGLLANDSDDDGDALAVVTAAVAGPANGSVTLAAGGGFTYTPDPFFEGVDTFTYRVTDGTLTDTATVTVTVDDGVTSVGYHLSSVAAGPDLAFSPSPMPPSEPEVDADGDGQPGVTIEHSGGSLTESDPAKYRHWTHTPSGPLALQGPVSLELWSFADEPGSTKKGHVHFYLHDCLADGSDCNLLSELHQHVDDWNGGASGWAYRELDFGHVDTTITTGRMLRLRLMFDHEDLHVAMSAARPSRLVVTEADQPPVAVADAATTASNTPVDVDVLANDTHPGGSAQIDRASVTIQSGPGNGTVSAPADGVVTYTPDPGWTGIDTFTYEVCDLDGDCATATVTVTVT